MEWLSCDGDAEEQQFKWLIDYPDSAAFRGTRYLDIHYEGLQRRLLHYVWDTIKSDEAQIVTVIQILENSFPAPSLAADKWIHTMKSE